MFQEKSGEKDLPALKRGFVASTQRLEDYIQKHNGGLITAIRNYDYNTMDHRMITSRKQKWEGKQSMDVLND